MGMTCPRFLNILSKNGHSMGPSDKIMGILHINKKGRHIDFEKVTCKLKKKIMTSAQKKINPRLIH
jgi:hypothetical protein